MKRANRRKCSAIWTSSILRGPDGRALPTVGSFHTTLGVKPTPDNTTQQTVYVVRGLQMPLLGRPAIQALNILSQLDSLPASSGLLESEVIDAFPSLFSGLGVVKGPPHKIRLQDDTSPYSLMTPRRVPLPMVEKVAEELKKMEKQGIIRKVDEPTDWCAGMVIVPKPNGSLRICGDFTRLNECVRRERHILPSVEHLLAGIQGAKLFSKLDANSGFHQIPLDEASQVFTTFITPQGRYCYRRLPFGISSAPEYFQKRMMEVLDGLSGVICMIDDILVFGATRKEHNDRLLATLERINKAGITLNRSKCQFSKSRIHFCGYIVDSSGVSPDPARVDALTRMPACQDVSGVRRFLGMANQLGRFSPNLAAFSQPLRELLVKTNSWCWGTAQQQAFDKIKAELSSSPVLALYNPNYETRVSSDASSYGLGAVIRQKQLSGDWRPVAYQSRAMTPTEQRYSQIEKEALGIAWACERFSHYLLGLTFSIETDHKPLVPLLSCKPLDDLPPHVLRFRLRLMRYHFTISHLPGKDLITADALSRAPASYSTDSDQVLQAEVGSFLAAVTDSLSASDERLGEFRSQQAEDEICSSLASFCTNGWPNKEAVPEPLKPYWACRSELSLDQDGLLLCGQRIVVPATLRLQVLGQLHTGHQGITKCRQRAKQSVWWPGLSVQLAEFVRSCSTCARAQAQHAEPLLPSDIPSLPWQRVALDFFDFKSHTYLVAVDYYSCYIELALMSSLTTSQTILHLSSIFARHGIPDELFSDNGPQFASWEFRDFVRGQHIKHTTSSPHYPQANGMAERAVQTVKRLLRSSSDPYAALLAYRTTPLESGYSPAQLLFSRQLRTGLPITLEQRRPVVPDASDVLRRKKDLQKRQETNFNAHHGARPLPPLPTGSTVFLPDRQEAGHVVSNPACRSYVVVTPSGEFRRNRRQINPLPTTETRVEPSSETSGISDTSQAEKQPPAGEQPPPATTSTQPEPTTESPMAPGVVVTRSGRTVQPPSRFGGGGQG